MPKIRDINNPTKAEVAKANKLLGANRKMIEDHFGSAEDALAWFHGCDIVSMADVINDLLNKFEQKKSAPRTLNGASQRTLNQRKNS